MASHTRKQGPASAEVAPHERVRGFLYGGEVLPVDQAAEEALKWAEEEEVGWLVGWMLGVEATNEEGYTRTVTLCPLPVSFPTPHNTYNTR